MRNILFASTLLASTSLVAQFAHMDRAKLLATHFGGKPSSNPPRVTWVPQGPEASRFEYLPDKHVVTVVDTMLMKGADEILVFFRTTAPMDGATISDMGSDWIGVASYIPDPNGPMNGWKPRRFEKWLIEQGLNSGPVKPRMLPAGGEGCSVFLVASDIGEIETHTRKEHYFALPDLKEALAVTTGEYIEERGGPHGPTLDMTERTVKVIMDPANWKEFPDIDVTGGEGTDGKTVRYTWNEQQKRYSAASSAPKPGALRPATKVPAKPSLKKH